MRPKQPSIKSESPDLTDSTNLLEVGQLKEVIIHLNELGSSLPFAAGP